MKHRFVWGFLIVLFVLFSYSPSLYEFTQKDKLKGRTFELVHNYITDYNFYLSRIRQGAEGRWTVVERYTGERHTGSLIQIFYLLLGKVHVHASDALSAVPAVYHASQIVLGMTVLALVALWVRFLFPSLVWQVIAFLVAVTASVWPVVVPVGGWLRFGGPMSWWTIMDNLQRITFLPHLLAGQALLVFLILAQNSKETLARTGNWFFLGILAFVLGMIFPPGLVFLGAVFGAEILLSVPVRSLMSGKQRNVQEWFGASVLPRIMIGTVGIPSFLYFSLMFSAYPWKRLIELDVLHPLPFQFPEYVQALGPTLPLGILGLILVFLRKDAKFSGVVAWVIAWLGCLFIFQFIPQQSPLRFSEMMPHVPLGILTAYVFYFVFKRVRGIYFLKVIILFIPMFLIMLGLGVMASSLLWQKDFIDLKIRAGWPLISMNNYIVYPLTTFTDAISFLGKTAPEDAIILSDMTAGNYIPAYTGRSVFVGHDNTVNLEKKLEAVRRFFRGEMTASEAQTFLRTNAITHVFFGPQEKGEGNITDLRKPYPFLTPVFTNQDAEVLKVP